MLFSVQSKSALEATWAPQSTVASKLIIAWPSLPCNITPLPSYGDATPPSWFVWRGWGVLFPVLRVKETKRRRKKNRERGRERKRLLQRPLGIGWFVVRLGRNLKREEEVGAGGGLPLSFLPLTKLIQPLPRGNSQSGTHLGQNRPKKHKNKMAEL